MKRQSLASEIVEVMRLKESCMDNEAISKQCLEDRLNNLISEYEKIYGLDFYLLSYITVHG